MALENFVHERRNFAFRGGSFSVGGIGLDHFAILLRTHMPDIDAIFDLVQNYQNLDSTDFDTIVSSLISQAPGLAANVIAVAADEPDATKSAAKLPFPVQIEVLKAIADLTFGEVGGVGKALENIAALLAKKLPEITKTGQSPL